MTKLINTGDSILAEASPKDSMLDKVGKLPTIFVLDYGIFTIVTICFVLSIKV